jgi:hypothetical protein
MEQTEKMRVVDGQEWVVLTPALMSLLQETTRMLKGSERRMFMAKTVRGFGKGGQCWAERELKWDRGTIRKGEDELKHGPVEDQNFNRGRKKAEAHLPRLLEDIRDLVAPVSQTDPTFRTLRQYRRVTAGRIREQLITEKGSMPDALPTERTIRSKLNELGLYPKKVAKRTPQKKFRKPTPFSPVYTPSTG